jgi:UDP-N-acetylmuramate dehydrogenase
MSTPVLEQVPLAEHTTFKTGGLARYFCTVTTPSELKAAVDFAHAKRLPFFVLGGGSNVLASDAGYAGVVIKIALTGREYIPKTESLVEVTCAAGEVFDDVVSDTVGRGLWGLENLSHIPGTVGATPVQNVGAYGTEVADTIVSVTTFDTERLCTVVLDAASCAFGYRDSLFKQAAGKRYIITAVTFVLSRIPQPQLEYADLKALTLTGVPTLGDIQTTIIAIRSAKFPDWNIVGTAGSFFKNPVVVREVATPLIEKFPALPTYAARDGYVKVSLGYILDKVCGLKGYCENLISLYEKQALVLVAGPGATTTEIEQFAAHIEKKVFEETNIIIEREVTSLK